MNNLLFLAFIYFAEMLILFTYAKSIYEYRKNLKFSFSISLAAYVLLFVINKWVYNAELVNIILTIIINILVLLFAFKSSWKSSLFYGMTLSIVQFVSEFVALHILLLVLKAPADYLKKNQMVYMIGSIISKIFYFFISRFLVKISLKEKRAGSWGRWLALAVLPLISVFIIVVIRVITNDLQLTSSENLLCICSISALMLTNIIIYIIYEQAERSNQKLLELEITNQKNDLDLKYLNLLEQKNESMQIITHDMKKHLIDIKSLSDSDEINAYIDRAFGEIEQYSRTGKTKNKMLDVILNKYIAICDEKNITFSSEILSENLKFINDYDLSAMLNNLLDNAVEAAEQSEDKSIYLNISKSIGSYCRIILENSCDAAPLHNKEMLITTKKNMDGHGYGIKSVNKTIKKYNGDIKWDYNDEKKIFKVIVALPT